MLDIKFIRENKDIVSAGARKKHVDFDVEALLVLDDKRKALQASVEAKKAKQNEVSTKIPTASAEERQSLINEMQIVKAEFQKEDEVLKELMKEWHGLMIQVPNIPDMSVPEGAGEEENKVVHEWGVKPVFDFEPKNHIDLMLSLDMVDFERGTKTHGFRGYFLKGDGAELSWAVWNYARDFFGKKRFTPFIAPAVIKKEFLRIKKNFLDKNKKYLIIRNFSKNKIELIIGYFCTNATNFIDLISF